MDTRIQIILILFAILILLFSMWRRAKNELKNVHFDKRSLSSKYGKMSEQFMPFLQDYPYDPQNFRFLGSPVDGVQFCEDKIVFIEFKTNSSRLSERQRQIADIVFNKKIDFEEHRIE